MNRCIRVIRSCVKSGANEVSILSQIMFRVIRLKDPSATPLMFVSYCILFILFPISITAFFLCGFLDELDQYLDKWIKNSIYPKDSNKKNDKNDKR